MIIFVLSAILGIFGVIPPQHFDLWRNMICIEMIIEISALLIWLVFGYHIVTFIKYHIVTFIQKRKHKKHTSKNTFSFSQSISPYSYEDIKPIESEPIIEKEVSAEDNPYEPWTIRWDAWNRDHGIESKWD